MLVVLVSACEQEHYFPCNSGFFWCNVSSKVIFQILGSSYFCCVFDFLFLEVGMFVCCLFVHRNTINALIVWICFALCGSSLCFFLSFLNFGCFCFVLPLQGTFPKQNWTWQNHKKQKCTETPQILQLGANVLTDCVPAFWGVGWKKANYGAKFYTPPPPHPWKYPSRGGGCIKRGGV